MAGQGAQNNRRQVRPRRQELRMIPNKEARHVSFSKRRHGLFIKASELATLCGVEVALIVNSPAGRPYTFGSLDVNPIFRRFLANNANRPNEDAARYNIEKQQYLAMINNLNHQSKHLTTQLEAVAFRRTLLNDRLKQTDKAVPSCNRLKKISELQVEELSQLLEALCKTRDRLTARKDKINEDDVASLSSSQAIGNNCGTFIEGFHPTDPNSVQTNQTNSSASDQMMLSSIPPSLTINPGTVIDTSFNPGLVFNFRANNSMMMQDPYGFSFGPFIYNQGNENLDAGNTSNNNQLFFDPNVLKQSQSYGMSNPPVPYNFMSGPYQFNTPHEVGEANYRPNQIDSSSLASLIWPSVGSFPQGQYFWRTDSFGQNMLPYFDPGAPDQAGPSNPSMNNLIAGPDETSPVDHEDGNPIARNSGHGPL